MSAPAVLVVDAVRKSYPAYRSNFQRFARWFGLPVHAAEEFVAVAEVSFKLARGESLAIIGQNGAGKSTLLKMIAGIVRPSNGSVGVLGSVSAMLELGIGFNPEFTGRQNVYVAGGLRGLANAQLDQLMPEIEAFAEIGDFFDRPVRMYSSGMQARLAFAVASAVRPDILIVDEVLSVGDSYFVHKCIDRIRAFRELGTSLIFVSHSMADVRALCDRVLLLDRGIVLKDGSPDEVADYYNALIAAKEAANLSVEQRRQRGGWLHTRSGTGEARIVEVFLRDAGNGEEAAVTRVGQRLRLSARITCQQPLSQLVVGFMLRDRLGHVVWGTNTWHTGQIARDLVAGAEIEIHLEFENRLGPGSYAFSMALHSSDSHVDSNYEWQDNLYTFDVVNVDRPLFIGSSWIDSTIRLGPHGEQAADVRGEVALSDQAVRN